MFCPWALLLGLRRCNLSFFTGIQPSAFSPVSSHPQRIYPWAHPGSVFCALHRRGFSMHSSAGAFYLRSLVICRSCSCRVSNLRSFAGVFSRRYFASALFVISFARAFSIRSFSRAFPVSTTSSVGLFQEVFSVRFFARASTVCFFDLILL